MTVQSQLQGTSWVYGDKIDTDLLAPGAYMKSSIEELAIHCLEAIDEDFAKCVTPGDILVAGDAFGIGSSREQAAQALVELGVAAVVAKSFARIFYRNALNLGLPVLFCPTIEGVEQGDQLSVDPSTGEVKNLTKQQSFKADPIPPELMEIVNTGGLMPHLKQTLAKQKQQSLATSTQVEQP